MTIIDNFLNLPFPVLILFFLFIYFIGRDIYNARFERNRLKKYEKKLIESEKRMYSIMKTVTKNRESLVKDLQDFKKNIDEKTSDIHKEIKKDSKSDEETQ